MLEASHQYELKLLIVEFDEQVVNLIKQTLHSYFDEIIIAENGESGFQRFRNEKPDLVISRYHMPVMNGMDMSLKMKKLDDTVRIVLVSDVTNTDLLTLVIENGINGIISEPINTEHFVEVVLNQIKGIRHLKEMKLSETRRFKAEQDYDKSKRILLVISQASAVFFSSGFNEKTVNDVLKLIGEVIDASRVYINKNNIIKNEEFTSRVYEWSAPGIMPAIGNLSVSNRPIENSGFVRWVDVMKKHRGYITGLVKDFTLSEQDRLKEHGIKSILALPTFVNDLWWGFIGIDDCLHEKSWTEPEITALEALANNFGAAIQKRDMDEQLIKLNLGLEKRVKERTRELEFQVAERSMAEALLKDSEDKYRLIYENATEGIMLIQKGRIVLMNPAMIEVLEDLPRNLIGQKFSDLVAKENRHTVERQFKHNKKGIFSNIFHVQVDLGDNNLKWLELKPAQILWYGEAAHLVFVSNITPRKNAESDLKELNESLERRVEEEIKHVEHQQQLLIQKSKLESIGELSAGLAHEINQPLLSISMGMENMLMRIADGQPDSEYFNKKIQLLFKDIDRIKNTIDHVRVFSRDQQDENVDKVYVSEVILDSLSISKKQLDEQNIELIAECSKENLKILGNRHKLEQVILNLISNSRYAVNEKAESHPDEGYVKRITIGCVLEHNDVIIRVRDNGVGIPAETLPVIFNPFFTTKSEDKGTGLGLSISYGIIKEMGGSIIAESEFGKFTEIKVYLPLYST